MTKVKVNALITLMYIATITSQGQVTVPVEARRKVGLKPGDKVIFVPVGGVLEIRREEGLEALRGIFKDYAKGKPELTPARLEKLRVKMYTERYKRFLKQNEPSDN